jgi:hypothetical protein
VDTVITDVAPFSPGVTLEGEKLHKAPPGKPEQDNATPKAKAPPSGLTVTVNLVDCPCLTVAELGLAATEKSAPTPLKFTLGLAEVIPSDPLTVSPPSRVPSAAGVNVTLKVHDVPPLTPAAPQLFICEKSPVIPIWENWKHVAPVLLSVAGFGLLEVFSACPAKARLLVEKLTAADRTNSYAPMSTVLMQSLLPSRMRGFPPKSVCGRLGAALVPASIAGEVG